MKIIFDNDATVVDYRRFIEKYAIPYFKKKYAMEVVHEDELELEDIFDCKNVLKSKGYSEEEAEQQTKTIINRFWVSFRYIKYTSPNLFFINAASVLRELKKNGHRIEIHTSRLKATDKGLIGRIARVLMYLQYWLNGCFVRTSDFYFYKNDTLKIAGIQKSFPDVVFEDKGEIIERLVENKIKCLCVAGKHNQSLIENEYIKKLYSYKKDMFTDAVSKLIGKRKWNLHNDIAKSNKIYRRILKLRHFVKLYYNPIILNEERLKKLENRSVIYVSNHRSTLDPIIITAIVNEPIRYAALKRFFDAEDSIFNNSKKKLLCKITAKCFKMLRFFPIERIYDNVNANNNKAIKDMAEYALIKGKVGIFPEGTTLKDPEKDFNTFNDSFIRLAMLTKAVIQPIGIYWYKEKGKRRPIVNFGEIIEPRENNVNNTFDKFMVCQKEMLAENKLDYI